ncbi:hypothetical protein [Cyanothece sp. BG0011]|uniref:hypothetical protein n=1 Tax=Cyanothece sp. BG0011 TaxID=2082950 RepID=UPI000D1E0AFD|nr:hypothetical protein [Cyanothece sp. BG0011]
MFKKIINQACFLPLETNAPKEATPNNPKILAVSGTEVGAASSIKALALNRLGEIPVKSGKFRPEPFEKHEKGCKYRQ